MAEVDSDADVKIRIRIQQTAFKKPLLLPILTSSHHQFLHIGTCQSLTIPLTLMSMESWKDESGRKKVKIVVGPWGGNGGTEWDDVGAYTGIREITLVYDHCIDSISVVYDNNGVPVAAQKHGGVGGSKTAQIKLQFPKEYLTSVTGHYCPLVYGGTPVIRSITFKSNISTYGPYGFQEGIPFSFLVDGGLIVGFRGRSGWYLDSIGFRVTRSNTKNIFELVHKKLKDLAIASAFAPNCGQIRARAGN